MGEWRRAGHAPKRVSVNLSAQQLHDSRLLDVVDASIHRSDLCYEQLELEITESDLLDCPPAAKDLIRRISDRGVRIAIEHFGAGYSSFTHLAQLPVNVLKLDRAFMRRIGNDSHARHLVCAMIAMGRELGFEIVAEGVETEQQYWLLQASGCHLAQGFGLARPQDALSIGRLLQTPDAVVEVV